MGEAPGKTGEILIRTPFIRDRYDPFMAVESFLFVRSFCALWLVSRNHYGIYCELKRVLARADLGRRYKIAHN